MEVVFGHVRRSQRRNTNDKCDALLFVYSVDNPDSFDDVLRCMDALVVSRGFRATADRRRLPVILVANKIDLVRRRIISLEGLPFSAVFFLD